MSVKQGGLLIAGGGSGGGGVATNIDNHTITNNQNNEIQTVAKINQNTVNGSEPYLFDWVGTLAQYNTQNVATLHPEWICYITDDFAGSNVNNSTITITQGGLAKGSFTLNQANNQTIALDAGGGGGSIAIDGTTITENTSNEIQAEGTINKNSSNATTTEIFDWVGTLSEYNTQDIATNHPTWLCYITDDSDGGDSVYTKAEVDIGFVSKGHEVIEFQAPTAGNNYTWYRLYADGWVEQGGITTSGTVVQSIVLPITMADTNYTISAIGTSSSSNNNVSVVGYENVSTTGFDTRSNVVNSQSQSSTANSVRRWQVSGMAA